MKLEVFLSSLKHVILVVKDLPKKRKRCVEINDSQPSSIEDADKYNWNYKNLYTSKDTNTYWYFSKTCKPRKNSDPMKQRDVPSMERWCYKNIY